MKAAQSNNLETAASDEKQKLTEPASTADNVEETVTRPELNTESSSPKQVPGYLEQYILRAEAYLFRVGLKRRKIFNRTAQFGSPTLRRDLPNRIIAFRGCFNPPHRGHLELLCHTFFRTDENTIAAVIIPLDELGTKDYQHANGLDLALCKSLREQLWNDDILQRFSWMWPCTHKDVGFFITTIQRLAEIDGFDISFTWLSGAEYNLLYRSPHDAITSDITQPAKFLDYHETEMGKPPIGKGWNQWQKASPARRDCVVEESSRCSQSPCWICRKVKLVFPEYFEKDFEESRWSRKYRLTQCLLASRSELSCWVC